jgi:hypothetical protein
MGRKQNLKPEDVMQLSVRQMLLGALGKLGGASRLGELLAELGDNDEANPSAVPDAIRARVLTELARSLGIYGDKGDEGSGLNDHEALASYIAMHESRRPADEDAEEEEPADGDHLT